VTLRRLVEQASNKEKFTRIDDFIDFACRFLEFAAGGLQAEIVAQNETQYRFWQYSREGHFNITRPINTDLMYASETSHELSQQFLNTLDDSRELPDDEVEGRARIRNSIYTLQQSIGATLDALPAGKSNTARKINGDLFERLILLLIKRLGVDCSGGVVKIPVVIDDEQQFTMRYQHDLILRSEGKVKAIGSVKTSSKDRIDKIFIDKFLYNQLTERYTPHLAIFLNDVQRGKRKQLPSGAETFRISSTFLPGHFKGYTIKLNPLDGVYYCDIRPSMREDPVLKKHVRTIDHFFSTDLWNMLAASNGIEAEVQGGRNPQS
jgi:hypothetical protein